MSESIKRYLCVHCDLSFDSEEGEETRCPKCMRKGAIPRPAAAVTEKRAIPLRAVAGVVVVGAALGLGYVVYRQTQPATVGEEVPASPLDARTLRGHLVRLRIDSAENRALFEASDAVESFAGDALEKESWPERARALAAKFAEARRSGRLVDPDPHGRRSGAFLSPDALAKALSASSGSVAAGSLELSLLAVVALRDSGVTARVVEILDFEGARQPPDEAGTSGYFGVLVRERSGSNEVEFIDVAGDSSRIISSSRRLDDIEVVAAVLTARAQISLTRDRDGTGALAAVDDAIRVDPDSVVARSLRAQLLAASGAIDDAVAEAEAAEQLRADSPRLVILASLLVGRQEMTRAESLARRAIELTPDYGAAYGIVAAASLARRDTEGARSALEALESKNSSFDGLPLLWANFHLMAGDIDRAVEQLESWVRARPDEAMVRLQAAHTLALVGRPDAALGHLRAALAMTNQGAEREALQEQIGNAFGPAVLAEVLDLGASGAAAPSSGTSADSAAAPDAGAPAEGEIPEAPGRLQLNAPTLGGARPNRPSLLAPGR